MQENGELQGNACAEDEAAVAERPDSFKLRINRLIERIQAALTEGGDIRRAEHLMEVQSLLSKVSKSRDEMALGLAESAFIAVIDKARNAQLAEMALNKFKASIHAEEGAISKIGYIGHSLGESLYFRIIIGMLVSCVIFLTISIYQVDIETAKTWLFAAAFAGALGSITSVLIRIESLCQEENSRDAKPFVQGLFRPAIGFVLGAVSCTALQGEFLPIKLAAGGDKLFWSYMTIAFFTGFSERLSLIRAIQNNIDPTTGGSGARQGK